MVKEKNSKGESYQSNIKKEKVSCIIDKKGKKVCGKSDEFPFENNTKHLTTRNRTLKNDLSNKEKNVRNLRTDKRSLTKRVASYSLIIIILGITLPFLAITMFDSKVYIGFEEGVFQNSNTNYIPQSSNFNYIPKSSQGTNEIINISKAKFYLSKNPIESLNDLDNEGDYFVQTFNYPYELEGLQRIVVPRGYNLVAMELVNNSIDEYKLTDTLISFESDNFTYQESIDKLISDTFNISIPYEINIFEEINNTDTIIELFYNFSEYINDTMFQDSEFLLSNTTLDYRTESYNVYSFTLQKGTQSFGDETNTYDNDTITHNITSKAITNDIEMFYKFNITDLVSQIPIYNLENISLAINYYYDNIPTTYSHWEIEGVELNDLTDYTYPQTQTIVLEDAYEYIDFSAGDIKLELHTKSTSPHEIAIDQVNITMIYLENITSCYLNGTKLNNFNESILESVDLINDLDLGYFICNISESNLAIDSFTFNVSSSIENNESDIESNSFVNTFLVSDKDMLNVTNYLSLNLELGNSIINRSMDLNFEIKNVIEKVQNTIIQIFNSSNDYNLQFIPLRIQLGDIDFEDIVINSQITYDFWLGLTDIFQATFNDEN